MTQVRIHWTHDERDLVIEAIAEHMRKEPRARFRELWEAGNAILPAERQRKWYSSYSGAQNADHRFFAEAKKRANVMGPWERITPQLAPGREHVPHEAQPEVTWVPVPTPQTLVEVPLKELLAEVIDRVLSRFGAPQREILPYDALQKVIEPLPQRMRPDDPGVGVTSVKTRPVRIACCGLLQSQFNRVKERVNAKKVELVLVSNQYDPTHADWKKGLDHAIVTRFVRHGHHEQAKQALGNERVHWVSSGTETVVAKVSELVPGSLN